jgi:hypothetical protein
MAAFSHEQATRCTHNRWVQADAHTLLSPKRGHRRINTDLIQDLVLSIFRNDSGYFNLLGEREILGKWRKNPFFYFVYPLFAT